MRVGGVILFSLVPAGTGRAQKDSFRRYSASANLAEQGTVLLTILFFLFSLCGLRLHREKRKNASHRSYFISWTVDGGS